MKTITTTPISAIPPTAAKLALAGGIAFVALLTALHFIKRELDPSWRMISEYEIGDFGWLMQLAFLSLAFGCVSLFAAVRSQIKTTGGKIGLALLLVAALGMTLAALGTTDPITATKAEMTIHGKVHGFGALLGIPTFPIAATLIALSLSCNQAWASANRLVFWTAMLTWVGLVVFVLSMAIMLPRGGGKFTPDVLIGWTNRFLILTDVIWLLTVAWQALKLYKQPT